MRTEAQSRSIADPHFGFHPDRIILFSRYALPGQAKTRLIPTLGAEKAAELQVLMSRHTLGMAKDYCSGRACDVEVRFAGGDSESMARQFGMCARYLAQKEGDLGARLKQAVETAFQEGARRVVVIGGDCPDLSADDLDLAFQALAKRDVVLGPARDGGYYLIGVKRHRPELFEGIAWGTDLVLKQTLARARECHLHVFQLPPHSDVDDPEDLVVCRRLAPLFSGVLPTAMPELLSIIIPTRDEASQIERTLSPLVSLSGVEILVADGGSCDATVDIARSLGVRVLKTRQGRGRQINAAAAQAQGDTLLFLHADTRLPPDFQGHVRSILEEGAIAGAFRLRLDGKGAMLRLVEWGANLRSRFRHLPYGDQALFLKAETFYQLGGFRHWPLMEDYEFVRRLRQSGRIRIAKAPVTTSARRWQRTGVLKTTLLNQLTIAAYHAGVSPETLARWYSARRGREDVQTSPEVMKMGGTP
jgi:rSAM/selenodomain-associated transferase 2/rSAM/selenodomain-associated transferase 1